MLRMILPKGTVFAPLTQWDIRKVVNHINSAPRENLCGETPYKLALKKYGPDILEALLLNLRSSSSTLPSKVPVELVLLN